MSPNSYATDNPTDEYLEDAAAATATADVSYPWCNAVKWDAEWNGHAEAAMSVI